MDLDVRTRVARDLGWRPVRELLDAIHDGDPSMRDYWPWSYWSIEPLDRRRPDWTIRYASAFQLGGPLDTYDPRDGLVTAASA